MKKIFSSILICILSLSFAIKTDALLSITHFNLGNMIIEELEKTEANLPESEKTEQTSKKILESEKNAFLSGMVYADIGRFYFDKITGIDSDSDKFAEEMSKFAKTSEEKWFVLGFKVHILQDNEVGKVLRGIFGEKRSSYKEYLKRCALLDNYFLQKNKLCVLNDSLDNFKLDQIIAGINNKIISKILWLMKNVILYFIKLQLKNYSNYGEKYFLKLYGDLFKKTYESFGFNVELNELQEQATNVLAASAVLSITTGKIIKIDEKSRSLIEKEMQNLSFLCVSYLRKEIKC